MSNPTDADALRFDKSLMIAMNYYVNAGYGGFYTVNLFSRIANSNQELLKVKYKNRYDKRTDKWIQFAIKNSPICLLGGV